jgi:phosphoenolpyruvate carboxylase
MSTIESIQAIKIIQENNGELVQIGILLVTNESAPNVMETFAMICVIGNR